VYHTWPPKSVSDAKAPEVNSPLRRTSSSTSSWRPWSLETAVIHGEVVLRRHRDVEAVRPTDDEWCRRQTGLRYFVSRLADEAQQPRGTQRLALIKAELHHGPFQFSTVSRDKAPWTA